MSGEGLPDQLHVRLQCLDQAMREELGHDRKLGGVCGPAHPQAAEDYEPQWLAEQAEEIAA